MIEQVLAEAGLSRHAIDAIAVGRGPGAFTGVRLAISVAQGLALGLDRPVVPVSTLAALALEAWVAFGADDAVGASAPPTVTPSDVANAATPQSIGARHPRPGTRSDEITVGGAEAPTPFAKPAGVTVGGAEAPTATTPLIVAALDARMGEVYAACFEHDADDLVTAITAEVVCAAAALDVPVRDAYLAAGSGWNAYADALAQRLATPPKAIGADLLPRASSIARLALRELARGNVVDAAHAQPVYLRDKVALTVAEQAAARSK